MTWVRLALVKGLRDAQCSWSWYQVNDGANLEYLMSWKVRRDPVSPSMSPSIKPPDVKVDELVHPIISRGIIPSLSNEHKHKHTLVEGWNRSCGFITVVLFCRPGSRHEYCAVSGIYLPLEKLWLRCAFRCLSKDHSQPTIICTGAQQVVTSRALDNLRKKTLAKELLLNLNANKGLSSLNMCTKLSGWQDVQGW